MIAMMLVSAWAGSFDGALFGKPFAPKGAVGLTDPASPGMVSILVLPDPISCDEARALKGGGAAGKKKPKKPDAMVVAVFNAFDAGSTAMQVVAMGEKGMGALEGKVTLKGPVSAKGAKGELEFSLTAVKGAKDGPMGGMVATSDSDHLKGTLAFELCDAVVARPDLSGTVFTRSDVDIVEKSLDPSRPPSELKVTMGVPEGWTEGKDQMGSMRWAAPDGVTSLSLSLSSPLEELEGMAAAQAKSQVEAFQTESTSGELVKGEMLGDGAYVAHWRYRWAEGPWTHQSDVFRQGEGWTYQVKCSVGGDDTSAAQVFDAAEKACAGIQAR